jgi:hypothetical protein
MELVLGSTWTLIYHKTKTFLLRVTVTLTITQMTLLAQTSHSDWLYSLLTYCTCSSQMYRGSEWVVTNRAAPHQYTFPLECFDSKPRWQAPSTSQLKRLDTSHNRHWLMQYNTIWHHVCSAKNKQKQNSGVENATFGCVPPSVLRYIEPNFISEDQPTLKWKSISYKYQ